MLRKLQTGYPDDILLPDPSKVGIYLVHRNVVSLTSTSGENTSEQSGRLHPDHQREDEACTWDAAETLRGSGLRILNRVV